MSEIENQLPADIDTLHALMVAACAERDAAIAERETAIGERDRALSQIDRLRHLLRQLQRAHFGKRSEKLDPDQLLLTLEDIEQAIAESEAHDDKKDAIAAKVRAEKRRANRGALPRHLPRVDVTIAPEDTNCPCCRTPMHVIGEETSERLDVIPAQFRVIVTHRPKYACRACEEAPVQAPGPGFVRRARKSRDQRIDIVFVSYSAQGEEGVGALLRADGGDYASAVTRVQCLALEAKRTAKIEFITEFSCELVQFGIAGSATSSRFCISVSQARIGYPKFNSKLQNCQQTDIAEKRPDECPVPSAGGKRLDQLAAGHLAWADVLDRGTRHGLRSGATIHHHVQRVIGVEPLLSFTKRSTLAIIPARMCENSPIGTMSRASSASPNSDR